MIEVFIAIGLVFFIATGLGFVTGSFIAYKSLIHYTNHLGWKA
jgi:hypothetical protein